MKKNTLIRWIFGIFFLLSSAGSFSSSFIAGLLFLLAAIISIPPTAAQIERKSNISIPGAARFFIVFILLMAASTALPDDTTQVNNQEVGTEAIAATPAEMPASTIEETPESEETSVHAETPESEEEITKLEDASYDKNSESKGEVVSLEDAKIENLIEEDIEEDSTEDEYQEALAKQEAEEAAEPEVTPESEETPVSEETQISGSTMQLSEAKKNELIGIIKEYYGADEVEVHYYSPTKTSPTGLMEVTYYLNVAPPKSTLEDDLTGLVITSKNVAEKSGIINPNVNVAAMLTDGTTSLGVGNYDSSSGRTDIHVEDINV